MKRKKEIIAWMRFKGDQPSMQCSHGGLFQDYCVYATKKQANFFDKCAKKVKITVLK